MFFELHPKYSTFLEQIEAFAIRTFSSLVDNDVRLIPLKEGDVRLVNKQLIGKRTTCEGRPGHRSFISDCG
jgi:hypothetical protein